MGRVNHSLLIILTVALPVITYIIYKNTIYTKEYTSYAKSIIKQCQPFLNTNIYHRKPIDLFLAKELKPKKIIIKPQVKKVPTSTNSWTIKKQVIIEITNHKIEYKHNKKIAKMKFKTKKPVKSINLPLKIYNF